MGAWGMAPFENDSFGDFQFAVARDVAKSILRKTKNAIDTGKRSGHSIEKWGAIGVVIVACQSTYLDMDECHEIASEAQDLWFELKRDDEWLTSWRNPKAFKKMFDAVGEELEDIVEGYGKHEPKLVQMLFSEFEKDSHKGDLPGGGKRRRVTKARV